MVLAKYFAVGWFEVRQRFGYVWDQVFAGVFVAMLLFIFFHVWTAFFAGKETVQGFSLAEMIWYLAITETLVISSGFFWIERIGEDVRAGMIGTRLLKPMNYVFANFFINTMHVIYNLIIAGVVAFIVAFLLVGPIKVSAASIALGFIAIFGGVALNYILTAGLGLLAFWVEDTSALYWIYQKGIFILGGMLVPLEIYPDWLRDAIVWLPFSVMTYLPSRLFIKFSFADFIMTMIVQFAWIVIGSLLLAFIYRAGLWKVQVHGG